MGEREVSWTRHSLVNQSGEFALARCRLSRRDLEGIKPDNQSPMPSSGFNLRPANALDLAILQAVLIRADEVIR